MTAPPIASLRAVTVLAALTVSFWSHDSTAQHHVDFNYAPARWYTPIGFIDDWQKSVVDEQGRLAYDFGPGPYARALTTVGVEFDAAADGNDPQPVDSVSQTLLDAKIPVVLTEHRRGRHELQQTAFALVPHEPQQIGSLAADGSWRRHEGLVGSPAWAPDVPGRDPAFRSVAWGTGRSIRYDIRVPAGSSRRVALGLIDVYKPRAGMRSMDLLVEGAPKQTVDIVEMGGQSVPQVVLFDGADVNQDGWLAIDVRGTPGGQDPNVILSGIWTFAPDADVSPEGIIGGSAGALAEVHVDAGMDLLDAGYVRMDALRGNLSSVDGSLHVRVNTRRPLTIDSSDASLNFGGTPFIKTNPGFSAARKTDGGWLLTYPSGTRAVDVLVVHGIRTAAASFPDLVDEQRRTVSYWQHAQLPWGRIEVPDPGIQDLIDGGIRTLYQVREQVDGYAQFQPGMSVYRGLWFGDGVWGAETATLIDDREAARQALEGMLLHQDADGRVGVMKPALLHRETAHLIYGMCRYARLTQDWDWLERRWGQLEQAMNYLIALRREASQDPEALYFGLFPPGLTDGGVGGLGPSYGSVYWGLIGMAEAVRTAQELHKPVALEWQASFDGFLAAFRRASARDMRQDQFGNPFLPIKMDFDPEKDVAQRGQWGPIHALYAGQFLSDNDPLVTGTLSMLDTRTEEGEVVSLGWLTGGVWPIFEAHRALAYNWLGNADRAEELLYSFANHATPTLLWVEEQLPKARGTKTAGDVPHTVGNMQAVRLVRFLILLEKDKNLELLRGLPLSWLHPGARLSLNSMPTLFGATTLSLSIDRSGEHGSLWVQTPDPGDTAGTVRLNLRRLRQAGYTLDDEGRELEDVEELPWNSQIRLNFRRPGAGGE